MLKYTFDYGRKILNMHINIVLKTALNSDIELRLLQHFLHLWVPRTSKTTVLLTNM